MKLKQPYTILTVDVSTGEVTREILDDKLLRKFIGGFGVGCRIAGGLIHSRTDPFASENVVIIGVGMLTGSPSLSANKIFAITKCPVIASSDGRNFIGYGSGGSLRFGWNLKRAGYDILVVKGKAKKPVYIKVDDKKVEICDATELWKNKDAYESADILREAYPGCGAITIGRAGENLVRHAMALVDKKGTLGRTGIGAVLGAKQVKAIIARGTGETTLFDRERFNRAAGAIRAEGKKSPWLKLFHEYGVHAGWEGYLKVLDAGVWSHSKWDSLYGLEKFKEVKKDIKACPNCLLGCKMGYKVKDGEFAGLESETGHYVLCALMGQRLGIEDHRKALKLLDMCNRAGLCALTFSNLANWVTGLYQQGVIDKSVTGGMVLEREFNTYADLLEKMVNREGFGDTLADGWYATSERVGRDVNEDYVWSGIVKGVDPILDARFWGLSVSTFGYLVNPRVHHGNIHCIQYGGAVHDIEALKVDFREMGVSEDEVTRVFTPVSYYGSFNVARMTRHVEDRGAVMQSLGFCDVYSVLKILPMEKIAECYSAATGFETSPEELKRAGERICNLLKVIDVREGFSRKDDFCPAWFKPISAPDGEVRMRDYYGAIDISKESMEKLLDDYYDERGWDRETGTPTKNKLLELDLAAYGG